MIPILYKETETEFLSNGIAQLEDTLIAEVTEVNNGEFELYLEYPAVGKWMEELKEFRYIQAKPNDYDDEHAFRIYEVEKRSDPSVVKIFASTKTNSLGDNVIPYLKRNGTPTVLYNAMKNAAELPIDYEFVSDITTSKEVEWEYTNPLESMVGMEGSMIDVFGGEIKKTNDFIYHYRRRGKDRATTIRQDKNIDGFIQKVSVKGLVTKILPYYNYMSDPDGTSKPSELITIRGSVVSSPKAKDYPTVILRPIDFSQYSEEIHVYKTVGDREVTDVAKTKLNLQAKANTYFTSLYTEVDTPKVEIDVDLTQLSDSPEYDKFKELELVGVTDTVDVWVKEYGIDVTVKVNTLVYDVLGEKTLRISAGSKSTSNYRSQEQSYKEHINEIRDYLNQSLDNIVQVSADGNNKIWTSFTKPTAGMRPGDTWFEKLEDGHMAIHYYDGIEWVYVLSTKDTTVNKDLIDDALAELDDVRTSADRANREINDAINNAGFTSLNDTIKSVQSRANTALDTANDLIGEVSDYQLTVDGFNQTVNNYTNQVANFRSDVDGFSSTVASYSEAVEGYTTQVSTIEQTAEGLQTTVASKASQTQVTQLADGFKVFAGSIDTTNKNLVDRWLDQKMGNDGESFSSSSSKATIYIKVPDNTTHLTVEDETWGGWYNSAFFWYNSRQQFLGKYDLGTNEDPGENIVTVEIPSDAKYFRYHTAPNMSKETKIEVGTEATGLYYDDSEIKSEISVLNDNINLRVEKGELLSQINIEADRQLFQSGKILFDAENVVFSGTAWMDGAVIANASIDGAKIQDATIGSAKIAGLDVGKISGDKANFVSAAFNSISSNVTINSKGLTIDSASSWDMELVSHGIKVTNKHGLATGLFTALIDPDTQEPKSLGVVAENGHDTILGYRGNHSSTGTSWSTAVRVNGTTGLLSLQTNMEIRSDTIRTSRPTIYPNWTGNDSFFINTLSTGGVTIRNSNTNGAGFDLTNAGEVHITGADRVVVSEIKPFGSSHTRIRMIHGAVAGNEGVWLRDHTNSSGIFMARNGELYVSVRGGIYSMRTVLQNSGFSNA